MDTRHRLPTYNLEDSGAQTDWIWMNVDFTQTLPAGRKLARELGKLGKERSFQPNVHSYGNRSNISKD